MDNLKIPIEDTVAIIFVVILFMGLVVLGTVSLTARFSEPDTNVESVAVRSPVDHTLVLIKQPVVAKPWQFKHCTPTNKDCGRFE
jgi:hypothetical protein